MGAREGREIGFRRGFELAEEVGYYAGCAAVWRTCATRGGDARGARVERLIESFERELRGERDRESARTRGYWNASSGCEDDLRRSRRCSDVERSTRRAGTRRSGLVFSRGRAERAVGCSAHAMRGDYTNERLRARARRCVEAFAGSGHQADGADVWFENLTASQARVAVVKHRILPGR